jgi:sortase A
MRRILMATATVLAIVGGALIAYPFATDLWASHIQSGLDLAGASDFRKGRLEAGDALTRLEIPKIGVDVLVVEGVSATALRAGAGHYPSTPLPGERGNVAIAGHRTTYGRPFNGIDELVAGDRIMLTTPIGRHVYRVTRRPWVVNPLDWSVVHDFPRRGSFVTLTSCHPEGSDDYRLVARAKLARSSDSLALTNGGSR